MNSNPGPLPANRRLHPVSILYFLIHSGKELAGLLPLIPFCIFLIHRVFGKEIDRIVLTACVIAAAAVMLIVFAWLRWRRFVYRVEDGVLYMEHGLWVRRKLWITKERIQSLNITVSLYDRMFGLVRLEMETSGVKMSRRPCSVRFLPRKPPGFSERSAWQTRRKRRPKRPAIPSFTLISRTLLP